MMTVDALVLLVLIAAAPVLAGVVAGRRLLRRPRTCLLDRSWTIRISTLVLSLYGAALIYAGLIEPHWVETTRTEIRVRQPVLGKARFRIVHLTDLHATDWSRRERRIREIVQEARPDVILMTGDYVLGNPGFTTLASLIKSFEAPLGIYGILGNNDPVPLVLEGFFLLGVRVLQDEKVVIERDGRRLCLAGRSEGSTSGLGSILKDVPADAVTLFLSHKPDDVDELSGLRPGQRVDLFLCGHTHGGQVCLPFWGAVVTESKYHKRYERGLYDVNGTPMYVNRGIGTTLLPLRFLSRPEVAVIDLVFKD